MKKLTTIIILFVFLISLASSVSAGIGDTIASGFKTAFDSMQNFVSGGYETYEQLIVFFSLFIIFTAAMFLGLKKAFGEVNRQIKVMAVIIALISALSIASAIDFSIGRLRYFALGLLFLILFALMLALFNKLGAKKSFALLLALLVASLIVLLVWFLISRGDIGVGRGIGDAFSTGGLKYFALGLLFLVLFILLFALFKKLGAKTFLAVLLALLIASLIVFLVWVIISRGDVGFRRSLSDAFSIGGWKYVALILLFLILFISLFALFKKLGTKNFLAFILALLIATLMVLFVWALIEGDGNIRRGLRIVGRHFEFAFNLDVTTWEEPGVEEPGVELGVELGEEPGVGEPPPPPPGEEEGGERRIKWWYFLFLLLPFAGYGGYKGIKYIKKKRGEEEAEKDIEEVVSDIEDVINLKKKILKNIIKIANKKEKLTADLLDLYHKTIRDPSYYLDRNSPEFKDLMAQDNDAVRLLKLEHELEDQLKELMEREDKLIKEDLAGWLNTVISVYSEDKEAVFKKLPPYADINTLSEKAKEVIKESKGYANYGAAVNRLMDSFSILGGVLLIDVKRAIASYFLISEDKVQKRLKIILKLNKIKKLEKWFKKGKYKEWKEIRHRTGEELREFFKKEKEILLGAEYPKRIVRGNSLYSKVNQQARYMIYILKLIEFLESKRKSFTELQPLKVEPEEAADPNVGVEPGTEIKRVYTRIARGIGPFTLALYIDNIKIPADKVIDSTERFPLVEFTSEEVKELRELTQAREGEEEAHGMPGAYGEPHAHGLEETHEEVHGMIHEIGHEMPHAHEPGEAHIGGGHPTRREHTITITAISPSDTYRRPDSKSIKIYVGAMGEAHEMPHAHEVEEAHEDVEKEKRKFRRLLDWLKALWERLKRLLEELKKKKGVEPEEVHEVEGMIHEVEGLIRQLEEADKITEAAAHEEPHAIAHEAEEVSRWAKFKAAWSDFAKKVRHDPRNLWSWILRFIRILTASIVLRARDILKRTREIEEAHGIPHEAHGEMPHELEEDVHKLEEAHGEIEEEKERLQGLRGWLSKLRGTLKFKKEAEPEKAGEIEPDEIKVHEMMEELEGMIKDLAHGEVIEEEAAHGVGKEEIAHEVEEEDVPKSRLKTWWSSLARNIRGIPDMKVPAYIIKTFKDLLSWITRRRKQIETEAHEIAEAHMVEEVHEANGKIQKEKAILRGLIERVKRLRLLGTLKKTELNNVNRIEKEVREMIYSIVKFENVHLLLVGGKESNARSAIKRAKDKVNINFKWLKNLWSAILKNIKNIPGLVTLVTSKFRERELTLSKSLEGIETAYGFAS